MKSSIDMGIECDFSFEMLYFAAFGQKISEKDKIKFQNLPQEKINMKVRKWAKLAGWKTIERIGKGNITYLAFYPSL